MGFVMFNVKYAVVELLGGLGNQLHQICFAKYLKHIGYEVEISTNWFRENNFDDGTTKRKLELDVSKFGFNIVSHRKYRIFLMIEKIMNKKYLKRFYNSQYNLLFKTHTGNFFDDSFFINIFNGYWQDKNYLALIKDSLIEDIKTNNILYEKSIRDINPGNTMLHIRKGDYIKWGEDMNYDYYEKSLQLLNKYNKSITYDIFTDDANIDMSISLFKNANSVFNDLNQPALKILSDMSNYDHFIISNSSLSYFAALIGSSESSLVIYPNPWFKTIDYLPYVESNWIDNKNTS